MFSSFLLDSLYNILNCLNCVFTRSQGTYINPSPNEKNIIPSHNEEYLKHIELNTTDESYVDETRVWRNEFVTLVILNTSCWNILAKPSDSFSAIGGR